MTPPTSYLALRKSVSTISQEAKANMTKMDVALLGDFATQYLASSLHLAGLHLNLNATTLEADYNQIEQTIIDPDSIIYRHQPKYIVFFCSTQKLYKKFVKLPESERVHFAREQTAYFSELINILCTRTSSIIIFSNFPELDDHVFGNYANKHAASFLFQIRLLNTQLMQLASENARIFLNDVLGLCNRSGYEKWFDKTLYFKSDVPFALDFFPLLASNIMRIISTIDGRVKKCLVLDLDNTLWGGVIGDDGLEGIQIGDLGDGKIFSEFQTWIKQLQQRGIILTVCSKNNEDTAKEPFEQHPEMVLRLADISLFVANWENKAENIRMIQQVLNIGFDSMVFLDDNPFERNIVRENIPDIVVPELPEDPGEYLDYLKSLNLFETTGISDTDKTRTAQYQQENERISLLSSFVNYDEYLQSLNIQATVEPLSQATAPRVAQLSQRSNQFNLRTIRYTEADLLLMEASGDKIVFSISLKDKFGNYGLISVIILEPQGDSVFIDSWLMSCRVLKRSVEEYALNTIVAKAKSMGAKTIIAEYLPTAKNALVKDHYAKLGFTDAGNNRWHLSIDTFSSKKHFITQLS